MHYLRAGRASDLSRPKEQRIFRFLEIFPGALSWTTLFLAVFLSWQRPVWVSYFIITFVIFWLFRTLYLAFHLRWGFWRMQKNQKTDWLKKLDGLCKYSLKIGHWRDLYHLVLLPSLGEPVELIMESLQSLIAADYPKEKMIVVLSLEERAGPERKSVAKAIKKEFKGRFFKLLVTLHPAGLPGEMTCHGSNDAWAAKQAKELIIDPLKIAYEKVIVSSFDVDTKVSKGYFGCLSFYYLTSKSPTRTSFQPIPLYVNNIWQAPVFSRNLAFSNTFWQIMCQERPEKMITFSSHAMSFKALVDVGFKQTNVVSDDSRIFWQCFLKYNGDYKVVPIFYPVSMDANVAPSFWQTMINVYKQQRRWAYGVGDIPYFLFGFWKNKKIGLRKKAALAFELIEGHWSWATASILIFTLGWLPIVLGGQEFSHSLLAFYLPKIAGRLMTLAMIGLIFSIYFSLLLLPPSLSFYGRWKIVVFTLGWFLLPLMMIFFASLPALDAQTRWMLGRYMGFWVTPKIRSRRSDR